MNNKSIKELTYASFILALTVVLVMLPIPFVPGLGLTLDLSYVALLIGRKKIGNINTYIICFIFPWFTLLTYINGGLPGAIFLFIQSLFLVTFDILFNKNNKLSGIFINVLLITIVSLIINVFLIAPMYVGGFSAYYNDFWNNAAAWSIVSIMFNPIKFLMVYNVIYYIEPKIIKEF